MKKAVSVILSLIMVLTLCPSMPIGEVITANAASDTYFWGFDDNVVPSNIRFGSAEHSLKGGILSIEAKRTSTYADPTITINQSFEADEVNQLRIRMRHDLEERDNQGPLMQLFYSIDNGDGTSTALNGGDSFTKNITLSSDGKFVTYIMDLKGKASYSGKIAYVRVDHVNCYGSAEIDYIMLTKADDDITSWEFDKDTDIKEWVPSSSKTTVSDGLLKFPLHEPVDKNGAPSPYDITLTYKPATPVKTSKYECVEVIMKHDISTDTIASSSDKRAFKMYLVGTTYDNNNIAANVPISEANKKLITLNDKSGESFYRYTFPLSGNLTGGVNIDNMDITTFRMDPINAVGTFEIDSIRFIPVDVVHMPLDFSNIKLSYSFKNSYPGCAKGTIKLDFNGQNPLFAKKINLKWASGDEKSGFKPLEGYKALKSTDGTTMSTGYTITKDLMIPEGATALIASVTDSEKTCDIAVEIPEIKRLAVCEPNYTIALTSDYHFGNSSSYTSFGVRQIAAYDALVKHNPDVITVAGDITQWYGAYSKAALDTLNDDNASNDNPTAGVSQWDIAFDYFTQFNTKDVRIPVYLVEGNHDTPEGSYSMDKKNGVTPQHMKDLLERWINYSVSEGLYPDAIERQDIQYNGKTEKATWYDDYVYDDKGNGYHLVFIRIPHLGSYTMPQKEVEWLDAKLTESEQKGMVTFLFTHVPYINTIGDYNFKYAKSFKDVNFKDIIDKHPKTIVVSGHTHYTIDSEFSSTVNGMMKSPSYVHQGSIDTVYINDTDQVTNQSYISFAYMYDDKIVIKGYDTLSSQWVPQSFSQITFDEIEESGGVDSEGSGTEPAPEVVPDIKTLIADVRDANGVNPLAGTAASVGTWVENPEIKDGYIGRLTSNEAIHRVTWQLKNPWQKQNDASKYVDISYNVYPLNAESTNFYLGTNQSNRISVMIGDAVVPFKWNNVRVIVNLATLRADTYVNGQYVGSETTSFGNASNTADNKNYFRFCLSSKTASSSDKAYLDSYIDDILIYETVLEPKVDGAHYLFTKGVNAGNVISDKVTMVVKNVTAGEVLVAALVDNYGRIVGITYDVCKADGLNEVTFDISENAKSVKIMILGSSKTLKPLTAKNELTVTK